MLEAVAKLEKLMEDFTAEYIDYDLSLWDYVSLSNLEDRLSPFPLDKLKMKVSKARIARAEANNAKMHENKIAKWKRYKYYKPKSVSENPKEKGISPYKELEVAAYEQACVILAYELMKGSSIEEINQKIKSVIPPITVEEIEKYLAKGKEGLQCFSEEAFNDLSIEPPEGKVNLAQEFNKVKAIGEINAFLTVCRLLGLNENITAKNLGFYGID